MPGAQLVIISGPSGVGKDAIIDVMKQHEPAHPRHYVITVTTRAQRENEIAGKHYHFHSKHDYELLRQDDGLLEASEVHGNWYGTPRDQVQSALGAGKDPILKIDVQGAEKIKARVPEALLIFVQPPSAEVLVERLVNRQTETEVEIAIRRENATREMAHIARYDHVVVNETDQLDETAQQIDAIIAAEHDLYPARRIRA
jgi:guanylate kinase